MSTSEKALLPGMRRPPLWSSGGWNLVLRQNVSPLELQSWGSSPLGTSEPNAAFHPVWDMTGHYRKK